MMSDIRSLYLHIPFCRSKCRYCDFASFASLGCLEREAYLSALASEIRSLPEGELDTLYFGGGTPSLLTAEELRRLLNAVRERFSFAHDIEITMEMNPGTVTERSLFEYRELGINRASVGVQSFVDRELSALGRIHSAEDACSALRALRGAGYRNVSLDLMYGIPHQTEQSFFESLDIALSFSPEHLSVYGLILEEGTPFYELRAELPLPGEDAEFAMYMMAAEHLQASGYLHYEVSNYARPGAFSRHNMTYWLGNPYYAAGLAAASFCDGVRRTNTSDLAAYIASPLDACAEEIVLTREDAAFEYMMLHLRLGTGIDEREFSTRFGAPFRVRYEEVLAPYVQAGHVIFTERNTALSDTGLYLSSAILTDLLP